MKFSRQAHWWLAVFAAGIFSASSLSAQDFTNFSVQLKSFSARANNAAPVARAKSPVDFFRQLLAMSSDERDVFLTNRLPPIRSRILAKVAEYEALDPNERELRLRATDLRWYLMPLLRDSTTNQAALLALMPDDVRELVQARLEEWTILPPSLKQEFLENEHILHYFAHVDAGNSPPPSESERAHWNELSEAEHRQITDGFNQFFDLTADEKEKALNTLSEAERQQMEKTLQSFDKMPSSQRAECVNAFAKFASMSATEKTEFLKNAARWSAMSPAERQGWRDLVVNVPQWPPLPLDWTIPIKRATPPDVQPAMATNKN